MAEKQPQTLENHGKLVPAYHFFAFPILAIHVLWNVWALITAFSLQGVINLLVAMALVVVGFYARVFALRAQDRVIRSEELQRINTLLSDDANIRAKDIRPSLFVALRFASDDELESLVTRVADQELKDQKSIKQAIKTWRPDYYRL